MLTITPPMRLCLFCRSLKIYIYCFYRDQNCTWEISATDSSANIIIDITFLNIELDGSCIYDYLEISESGIYRNTLTFLKELSEVF
jgi:hypothetical protein